ncbi:XTP/dITP diphosphatase [Desulfothermus naphthae]
MELVLATRNQGKIREIKNIILKKNLNINVLSLEDFPDISHIPEPEETFEGNALYKAKYVCEKTGHVTLSDDSGLEVDALDGRPGVYSARFAGDKASDEENNRKLLEALKDIPFERRGAQFRCVMVLYANTKDYVLTQGIWRGKIALKPEGNQGFGYDPIFFDENLGKCAAMLSIDEKNRVSHRAKALEKISKLIKPFFEILF